MSVFCILEITIFILEGQRDQVKCKCGASGISSLGSDPLPSGCIVVSLVSKEHNGRLQMSQ